MDYSEQVVENCYHEAAHAVFLHRAKVEVVELRVGGEGKIKAQWPTKPLPNRALNIAAGCLAGPLSVSVMLDQGFHPMTFDTFASSADFAEANQLMGVAGSSVDTEHLQAIFPEEFADDYKDAIKMLGIAEPVCGGLEQCYRIVIDRVERGFEEWWEEIDAVAKALLQARRLDGHETVRIIESVR